MLLPVVSAKLPFVPPPFGTLWKAKALYFFKVQAALPLLPHQIHSWLLAELSGNLFEMQGTFLHAMSVVAPVISVEALIHHQKGVELDAVESVPFAAHFGSEYLSLVSAPTQSSFYQLRQVLVVLREEVDLQEKLLLHFLAINEQVGRLLNLLGLGPSEVLVFPLIPLVDFELGLDLLSVNLQGNFVLVRSLLHFEEVLVGENHLVDPRNLGAHKSGKRHVLDVGLLQQRKHYFGDDQFPLERTQFAL